MGVICPICGDATAFIPEVIEDERAFLVDQSTDKHTAYAKARVFATTGYRDDTRYAICDCANCGKNFLVKERRYVDSDWVVVYPIPHRSAPQEVPEPIKSELEEAEVCFAIGAVRACAAMCQRVMESVC